MNPKTLHEKILTEFRPYFKTLGVDKLEEYSKMDLIFNEFSKNENSLKMLFDNCNYKILAVSDNIEQLTGYTMKELSKANVLLYFKALEFDHLLAPVILGKWANKITSHIATLKNINYDTFHFTICGIKMRRKDGTKGRTLQRYIPIEVSSKGHVDLCVATGEDIFHLPMCFDIFKSHL